MTAQEMHNQVNLGLQSLDSNRFDDFLPEEIDIALNNAQLRWVKQVYDNISPHKRDGFEVNEKRVAQLSSLVTYTEPITPFSVKDFEQEKNIKRIPQPQNLLYQIGTRFKHNSINWTTSLTKTLVNPAAVKIAELDFKTFFDAIPDFNGVEITITTTSGDQSFIKTPVPEGVIDKDLFVAWLQSRLSENNKPLHTESSVELYYEKYRDVYLSGGLVFVGDSTFTSVEIARGATTQTASAVATTYPEDFTVTSNGTVNKVSVGKFYTHDDIEDALKHSFKSPSLLYSRIPYVIKDRNIVLYDSNFFNVTSGIIKFIRKPNIISLSLKQDCELPVFVHDEIVQMAVYELMQKSNNPGSQSQAEFLTRTE